MLLLFSSVSALVLLSLQFLLPWPTSCTEQDIANVGPKRFELTRKSLEDLTAHLTGGCTDPRSVRLPADLAAERSNRTFWTKYIIGSVIVFGGVDSCALNVIRLLWNSSGTSLIYLLEDLVKKNDLDTVAHFIAKSTGDAHWDTVYGKFVMELVENNWNVMRPLLEEVLAILKEDKKVKEYGAVVGRLPIELQYEMIDSGKVPLGAIDEIYHFDRPFYSPLREIFFRARWSHTPNPQIRRYIAEKVPWFRQFMPEDIPSNAKNTCVTSNVGPNHDVWIRIHSFMDFETLALVWPLVCKTWNESYSSIITEDVRIHEWFRQDLNYTGWHMIHKTAPWNRVLNGNNTAVYLGLCLCSGAPDAEELDPKSDQVGGYPHDVIKSSTPIPTADNKTTPYGSFAKLIEESYKAYYYRMPVLYKSPLFTDEEYERVLHHLVCRKGLAVRLSCWWIIDHIPRIYSILGENQTLIQEVVSISVDDYREALFIWIMIGQACGMTEDTAKSVFNRPGTFALKFIIPTVVESNKYYNFIVESCMLIQMIAACGEYTACEGSERNFPTEQLRHLMISLILFFKASPYQIETVVASMNNQLPTLKKYILKQVKDRFGATTMKILMGNSKYSPEDVEFVKQVLTRCGLLEERTMWSS